MKSVKRSLNVILSLPAPLLFFLLSLLPLRLLYLISRLFSFTLQHLVKYRREVILQNLRQAFPQMSDRQIGDIVSSYYSHTADITLEAFKGMTASAGWMRRHITLSAEARQIIGEYFHQKESIIIVAGHYGNWEWIGPGINLSFPGYLHTAYRPLKNPVMDWMVRKMRTRFGHVLVPSDQVARHMINSQSQGQPHAFTLVADQAPSPRTAQWMTFMNQDTPFFTGPGKLATRFNRPVIFCSLRKEKRGRYLIHAQVITRNPSQTNHRHITREYARLLEEEIIREPQYWLWSHRRWKHKR